MNGNNKTTTTTTTNLTTTATTKDMNYRIPITESDEDELLASSQETSKGTAGHTNLSIPADTAVITANVREEASTSKAAMSTNQSALAAKGEIKKKRKKSQNQLRKNRYQRAVFILGKIAKDQAAGTPVDEAETKRLKAIVEEYESYLKRKQSEPLVENIQESTSQKRNRSTTETPETLPKKPRRSEGEQNSATAARHFCDVARDSLQVAIIDGNSSSPSTVQERWVEIDVRLSSMVLSYVLDNPAGPHPEFDSSETLRGYRVIKCADQASLDFLTGSVAKISNAFVGLQLRLIPARDIPKRPRARIWLPPLEEPGEKLLRCIKLQNKSIPGIDEWQLIKEEKPNKASRPILVAICEESIEALKKTDYKISFGIRKARLKIFQGDKAADEDDTEEVDDASQLLRNVGIEETRDAQ
ncbi:uncharacterized protein LOC126765931 [Bactrocera neohumeralis]|uniref:uncharacterized protein LOC126765931 n=1 Tax=Bactrocera neohumeralis TaxID=98809 RepID=UPI0021663A7D|nr:uncharacterized protein LOC126765931 [Bactrocera neohumeralis]XP_050339620.1 uncharacterized protein LOC126765931 [Bactrocera neohumeralis]